MAEIVTPRTLSGFMELSPKDQLKFNSIKKVIEEVYQLHGFYALDTPVLELSEVLMAKTGGEEIGKQIYRFTKGDTDLTMRFDLTVPLAKYVAKNYGELTFPFKRYQIGKVYRGERAQRGRFREFYQSDIDIIGDGELDIYNDAIIPSIIYQVFTRLGLDDFVIRINNRKVLNGFIEGMGINADLTEVLRIVDKIEKVPREVIVEELGELGLDPEGVNKLVEFIQIKGAGEEVFEKAAGFGINTESFNEGISELKAVVEGIESFNVPADCFCIDFSIARGLDYYTGTVYETMLKKHPEIGSVCSGGRYDNLAAYYTKKTLPGVGMSIGLTRLFYILNEKKYISTNISAPSDILILPFDRKDYGKASEINAYFISQGIRSQVYFENKKVKAKMKYADSLGIPFVILLGEDEIEKNVVSIKNLATGEQQQISKEEAVLLVQDALIAQRSEKIINISE